MEELRAMFSSVHEKQRGIFLLLPLILFFCASAGFAQGTAFTFQGKLGDSGSPVNGMLDMQFKLFSDPNCTPTTPTDGCQIGTPITLNNPLVQVTNGVFTVQLDFGAAALPGADRYLEIGLRRTNNDPYTLLSPRSKITSSPYAIRSLNAAGADSLSNACSGCVLNSQIGSVDASKLTGTLPPNSLPSGSSNYIQNGPLIQQTANFNILGTGTATAFYALRSLGIGTTTPVAKIDIAFGSARILVGDTGCGGGGGGGIGFGTSLSGCANYSMRGDGTNTLLNRPTGGAIFFRENNASQMTIATGGNVGVGTTTPASHLHVKGPGDQEIAIESSDASGRQWALRSSRGGSPNGRFEIVDRTAGASRFSIKDNGNVGIGTTGPFTNVDIAANSAHILIGDVGCNPGFAGIDFETDFLGYDPCKSYSLTGDGGGTTILNGTGRISFRQANVEFMTIAQGRDANPGVVTIKSLPASVPVCTDNLKELVSCFSSLRYKTNIKPYIGGLDIINRLYPISYTVKQGGLRDIGLAAEDVAKVEPRFTFTNDKGEIEGVKYDHLNVVLINAVKEQQAQIESQQKQIGQQEQIIQQQKTKLIAQAKQLQNQTAISNRQQSELVALKKLVCMRNRKAQLCRATN